MRIAGHRTVTGCVFALVTLSTAMLVASPQPAPERPRIDGAWILNRPQSSGLGSAPDAPENGGHRGGGFGGGMGRPGGGMGGGMRGGAPPDREAMERRRALVSELVEPSPRLTVTTEGDVISFTRSDGRVRKYRADGKKEKHQFDNGTVETKTKWEKEQLIVETALEGGMKVIEEYTVNDKRQLVVGLKFEGGRGGGRDHPPVMHVYDDFSAVQ
jgi:hypothetical protein